MLQLRVVDQLGLDCLPLQLELMTVADVLPLAPAARAEVGAGRSHPMRRALDHVGYDAVDVARPATRR